jgi:hypothetical protein
MNYGIATIVNSNGSMADLDDETIVKLPDEFTQEELVNALEELYVNDKKRDILGKKAKETILSNHAPDKCARKYFESIETFYTNNINENDALIDSLIKNNINIDDSNLKQLADCISRNHQYSGEKQLFIDVSSLVKIDSKSGIQRVVKSILKELLENPPAGYRIEPVYSTVEEYGYKYARNFTYDFLSYPLQDNRENLIDFKQGDIFLGLDLSPIVISKVEFYKILKSFGVKTYFIIYDILPIIHPEWWTENICEIHTKWLETVLNISDSVNSISKAVSYEVKDWVNKKDIKKNIPLEYKYFHLGADVLRRIAITLNQLTHIVKLQLTAFAHLVLFQAYLYITLQVECRKASNSSISLFTCLQALLVHKFYILILIHKKDFYHTIACLIIFQKGIPIKRFDIRVRSSYINSYKRPVIN